MKTNTQNHIWACDMLVTHKRKCKQNQKDSPEYPHCSEMLSVRMLLKCALCSVVVKLKSRVIDNICQTNKTDAFEYT